MNGAKHGKIGTQMTQILRIYADFDSEQSSATGCAHSRVRHCDGEERAGSNLPIRIPFFRPEIASPLIARSSQCAFRNDDKAGNMRRLEKNPKDFFIREIRNKWKLKIKNS